MDVTNHTRPARVIARIAESHHGIFAPVTCTSSTISGSHAAAHRLATGRWESPCTRRVPDRAALRSVVARRPARGMLGRRHSCRRVAPVGALQLWDLPERSDDHVEITCPRWRRARARRASSCTSRCVLDDVTSTSSTAFRRRPSSERSSTSAAVVGQAIVDLAIDNALRRTSDSSIRQLGAIARRLGESRARRDTGEFRESCARAVADGPCLHRERGRSSARPAPRRAARPPDTRRHSTRS